MSSRGSRLPSPQVSSHIPFDEVVGYRVAATPSQQASFVVGVLRGQAAGLALIEAFTNIEGAVNGALSILGGSGILGSFPPPVEDDGSARVEVFGAIAVGDDLVVIASSGLSAEAFNDLLLDFGPVDDSTWSRWITETPLDQALAELERASSETAEAPSPTDVAATSP